MSTYIFNKGFPPTWKIGILEKEIFSAIKNNIKKKYPDSINLIISPVWLFPIFTKSVIEFNKFMDKNPENIFISLMSDPLISSEILNTRLGDYSKHNLFGYTDTENYFDFWAINCFRYFKKYNIEDLKIKKINNLFLNYNRKPHFHRKILVNELLNHNLDKIGIITLGTNKNLTLHENIEDFKEWGSFDAGDREKIKIPNDIHSLGIFDIWQTHLVNIVSETTFTNTLDKFVSEKTWKPIIGMRPFMLFGNEEKYQTLKNKGFDTFEDLWPYVVYSDDIKISAENIAKNLQWLNDQGQSFQYDMYNSIYPRLLTNRNRFFEYAAEQNARIPKLFS